MQHTTKRHKKLNSKGFTLVEMAVTLVIISLVLAITFVGLRAWMRNAEFKKCNEYAHTIYTSASLELSALDLASDLDRFTERVKASGTPLQTSAQLGTGAPEDVYADGRMYAVTAEAGAYEQYDTGGSVSAQAMLVYDLIDQYSYDKEVCDYTITIEYDTEGQSVYAVFISTKAESFVYGGAHDGDYKAYDESGIVSLNAAGDYALDRSSEVRKALMLGYYCVDDLGIRAALSGDQLRVTTCRLENAETLDLVVASTSHHEEADVKYTATIYRTDSNGDKPMFDVTYSLTDLYAAGYDASNTGTPHMIACSVSVYHAAGNAGTPQTCYFPVSYVNRELHITLDASMSAQTIHGIEAADSLTSGTAIKYSTSIQRFLQTQGITDAPDIHAAVRVQQLTESDLPAGYDTGRLSVRQWIEDEEYLLGSSAVSNTENALYGSVNTSESRIDIAYVRHLANIRYYHETAKTTTFQLTKDLEFDDACIYDMASAGTGRASEGTQPEHAMELMDDDTRAFPAIPEFYANWTLTGNRSLSTQNYALNDFVLTERSIVEAADQKDRQFGLILYNEGSVESLVLNGSTASLNYDVTDAVSGVSDAAIRYTLQNENQNKYVRAAGVLCGLNQGLIRDITMDEVTSAHLAVNYTPVTSATNAVAENMYGIGLVCGVHEGKVSLTDIRTDGELEGHIYDIHGAEPAVSAGEDAVEQRYRYAGIGGVCGLTVAAADAISTGQASTAIGARLTVLDQVADFLHLADRASVKNVAEISGNAFVGGITGNVYLGDQISVDATENVNAIVDNCSNEGLIHLEDCFAGGIVGYLQKGLIRDCTSAPGAGDAEFTAQASDAATSGAILADGTQETQAHAYLSQYQTGDYVGGIAGCVVAGILRDCETTEGGYVLGNDEVGGIVGYLASISGDRNRLTMTNSKELHNSCYVIGHSNVGGIVGSNHAGNVISKCVNEGIVVGDGRNIGGIAGINIGTGTAENDLAIISQCTSEVFDYDDSIFTLVSEVWQIYGDNVGGLVGLNEYGEVRGDEETKTKANIASIVVGHNNVGGVFGQAGRDTSFDFKYYTLDGGEVYANGDNAGGYIGINLCAGALPEQNYAVKPYSVRGRYAVGGAIGANMVLQKKNSPADTDSTMKVLFSNDNAFGSVYGANAVGGIIGYQRNAVVAGTAYDGVYAALKDMTASDGMNGTLVSVSGSGIESAGGAERKATIWLTDRANVSDEHAQYALTASSKVQITGDNAASVIAGSYGGGILGYGCAYDQITVKNCENSGDVSDWQAAGVTGDELIGGSIALSDLYDQAVNTATQTILSEQEYSYNDLKQALGADTVSRGAIGSFVGGIQGYVAQKTTVLACTQTGMIYAQNGFGGIAGINLGTLKQCNVGTNLGTQDSSLVGGIAAINGTGAVVNACTVGQAKDRYTIEGKNVVGGLFAINRSEDIGQASQMYMNINGASDGYGVGGLAGIQLGRIALGETLTQIRISGGRAVGGVAGYMQGELAVNDKNITDQTVAVNGMDTVGGVFGILKNVTVVQADQPDQPVKYANAASVTATHGCAGGIAGQLAAGTIEHASNLKTARVDSYGTSGYAGGIVAYVGSKGCVSDSSNLADVTSYNSYAGGICAINEGKLENNTFRAAQSQQTISSGADSMGVIAAQNSGTIIKCKVTGETENDLTLQGSGSVIGGIVGTNTGIVSGCTIDVNYQIVTTSDQGLTIGGAIGKNEWQAAGNETSEASKIRVSNVRAANFDIVLEGNCAYFGGLIGCSSGSGVIADCSVENLKVTENEASAKGSCYGGLIGESASSLQNSTVKNIRAMISGLYQANITLNAEKQENLTSCFGGLVGKNQTDGSIGACTLDTSGGYSKNQIIVTNGLVGGIAGLNKGAIMTSGYESSEKDSAVAVAVDVQTAISKYEQDYKKKSDADQEHVDLQTEKERVGYEALLKNKIVKQMIRMRSTTGIAGLSSNDNTNTGKVKELLAEYQNQENGQSPNLFIQLSGNGSIGGITAYNTQSGALEYCMTGNWLIHNSSSAQYSAQGGVIGTNESDQDMGFLINQATVLRESSKGVTERVNGGIIGFQHNTTSDQWKLYGCINTGRVLNVNSHYSGGIIGRWSDQGGSIEYCRNYGVMQTSYRYDAGKGAAGGIVAQLYHPVDGQSYTILSSRNDGSILGIGDDCMNGNWCANDSGGIMGNIVTYEANGGAKANPQALQVNLIDCVNGPDVTIISYSIEAGVLAYLTSDGGGVRGDTSMQNLELNFDRCRNYATDFRSDQKRGFSGIFGDRPTGHEKTRITNCFTLIDSDLMSGYGKRGYICHDGGVSDAEAYKHDGGKSAICYNNRVLLVSTKNSQATVDPSVTMSLGTTDQKPLAVTGDGICYSVLDSTSQKAAGLGDLLKDGAGTYQVSGTNTGTQLYIQLREPMRLGSLQLDFDEAHTHSYRVEYLTEDADALTKTGSSIGNNFTLAKEVICEEGAPEAVTFPDVPVYAIRIQYVQDGITRTSSKFDQYGYYYSERSNRFTLTGLLLTAQNGTKLRLDEGTAMVSPRFTDSGVTNNNYLRGASTQYLYVADENKQTYLIEPQFEDRSGSKKRLSDSADARKSYSEKTGYTLAGNELFSDGVRPYGMVYARMDGALDVSSSSGMEQLDAVITDHYATALAAAMPYEAGSLLPETPKGAEITLNTDDTSVDVHWENSIDGATNVVKYYLVTVADADSGTEYLSEKKCIGNSIKLDITSDMYHKRLKASVRAVNENGTSDVCTSNDLEVAEPLPTPQIRLELVKKGANYKYQISVENQEDYEQYGDQWQVTIYKQGADKNNSRLCTLTKDRAVYEYDGSAVDENNKTPRLANWQLTARATVKDNSVLPSAKYTTAVYTPKYIADTKYHGIPGIEKLYTSFDGTYTSELDAKLNVHIQSKESNTGIYPVYQVDLIRVDGAGHRHILESKELAVSDRESILTFSDLPESFFNPAKAGQDDADTTQYFYVRAWVSQTGVGPVYTWHETEDQPDTGDDSWIDSGSLLVNTSEDAPAYVASAVLEDQNNIGTRVRVTDSTQTAKYVTSARPELQSVKADYDADSDQLHYIITWSDAARETKSYELQIYGCTDDARILLEKVYPIAKGTRIRDGSYQTSYDVIADDWSFNKLEVVIVQRDTGYAPGDSGNDSKKGTVVPRVLRENVNIRTRLPQLSQPSVKLVNRNDLRYLISWQNVSAAVDEQERSDLKYALYVNGKMIEPYQTVTDTSAIYDLEDYAGQTVRIYAIAYTAKEDLKDQTTSVSPYFKSPIGLKKRLKIGTRLEQPGFASPAFSWSYRDYALDPEKEEHALTESQFTSGALKLHVRLNKNGNYVMNAVLFDNKNDADHFIRSLSGTPYDQYVEIEKILSDARYQHLSEGGKPVMLSLKEKADGTYVYTVAAAFRDVSYAGGYIVPLVRATASTAISSYWTFGEPFKMPRVRLDTPNLNQHQTQKTYPTFGESLSQPDAEKGVPFTNVSVNYEMYSFSVPSYVQEDRLTLTARDGKQYVLTVRGDQVIVHSTDDVETAADKQADPNGGYNYTYSLSGENECILDIISNTVSGSYRRYHADRYVRGYYRMTFDTGIRRKVVDGVVTYELRLPQTRSAVNCDGRISISGTSRLITNVFIQAIPVDETRYQASAEKQN